MNRGYNDVVVFRLQFATKICRILGVLNAAEHVIGSIRIISLIILIGLPGESNAVNKENDLIDTRHTTGEPRRFKAGDGLP